MDFINDKNKIWPRGLCTVDVWMGSYNNLKLTKKLEN